MVEDAVGFQIIPEFCGCGNDATDSLVEIGVSVGTLFAGVS